jgi:L-rhamnose isomerase
MSVLGLDPTDTHEEFKEYTVEEIYEMYCQENNVADEVINYIDYLETIIKRLHDERNSNRPR